MLKIAEYRKVLGEDGKSIRREKIDLKELEKFNYIYDEFNECWTKEYDNTYEVSIFKDKTMIGNTFDEDEYIRDFNIKEKDIPDLIQAGLVEKVSDDRQCQN